MPASMAHWAQIELPEGLAEVGFRGLTEAVDGEAAALAEVDLVGVHLEDLLLVEARFELVRDHDFGDFAGVGLLRAEKEAAGKLLGQGGAAAGFVLRQGCPGRRT